MIQRQRVPRTCNEKASASGTSIAGKHTVQLDVDAARWHFGTVVAGFVSLLSDPSDP
jgi:hypothetical protein